MSLLEYLGLEGLETEDFVYIFAFHGPRIAVAVALLLVFIAFLMAFGEALVERLFSPKLFTLRTADRPPGKSNPTRASSSRPQKDPAQKMVD
jgi:hypothetical protein